MTATHRETSRPCRTRSRGQLDCIRVSGERAYPQADAEIIQVIRAGSAALCVQISFIPTSFTLSETFHMNPQLVVTVPDDTDVILSVAQNNALEPQVIGFTGYDLSEEASSDGNLDTTKNFFKSKRSLVNSQYTNSRQVTLRTRFPQGYYLILPTTYEANQVRTITDLIRSVIEFLLIRRRPFSSFVS